MTTTLARSTTVRGSRRTRRALAVVVVAALSVVGLVAYLRVHSQSSAQSDESALVSLTPVLPNLGSGQAVYITHPLCDTHPPTCTTAIRTWSVNGTSTFDDVEGAVPAWAVRNRLHDPSGWDCGMNQFGLFGESGSGCVTWFAGPGSGHGTFLAVTFVDQTALKLAVENHPNAIHNPPPTLRGQALATVSVQVS